MNSKLKFVGVVLGVVAVAELLSHVDISFKVYGYSKNKDKNEQLGERVGERIASSIAKQAKSMMNENN